MTIKRATFGGPKHSKSYLIKNLSPHKLAQIGANLIRSGAAYLTDSAIKERSKSIKRGGSPFVNSDTAELPSEFLGHLGLSDKPESQPNKPKQNKPKQNKPKQNKPKQTKPKENKLKQNKQNKTTRKPIKKTQNKIQLKQKAKSQVPNIFS